MSNTGQKGITYLKGQGVYKGHGRMEGQGRNPICEGGYRVGLPKAIRVRNALERALGKPRADKILRSFGVAQGKTWRRRIPKKKRGRR